MPTWLLHPASLPDPPPASSALLQLPPIDWVAHRAQCAMRKVGQGAGPCGQSHHRRGILIHEDPELGCLSPDPQAFTTHPSDRHCLKQTHQGGQEPPDPGESLLKRPDTPKAARHRTLPGADTYLLVFLFWPCYWACRIKPVPLQWECGTLTTGLPAKSLIISLL